MPRTAPFPCARTSARRRLISSARSARYACRRHSCGGGDGGDDGGSDWRVADELVASQSFRSSVLGAGGVPNGCSGISSTSGAGAGATSSQSVGKGLPCSPCAPGSARNRRQRDEPRTIV